MSAAATKRNGDDEKIAVSPASIAAPANATQVVNSDEPFNSLRRRFNSVSDCCAESGALKVVLRASYQRQGGSGTGLSDSGDDDRKHRTAG